LHEQQTTTDYAALLLLLLGMIILNAHKVTDISGEGFAVRLYRQGTGQGLHLPQHLGGGGNAAGFLRAFSDSPNAFAAGFNRVEKVCGAVFVLVVKGAAGCWLAAGVTPLLLAGVNDCS
jgi:hypothetical protein